MTYKLEELLNKMGTPEVAENGAVKLGYSDKNSTRFVEVKIVDDGSLVAHQEITHNFYEEEADAGKRKFFIEEIFLHANKVSDEGGYQVTRIETEEEKNLYPEQSLIELQLGIFHSRTVDTQELIGREQLINRAEEALKNIEDNDNTLVNNFNNVVDIKSRVKPEIIPKRARGIVAQFPGMRVAA